MTRIHLRIPTRSATTGRRQLRPDRPVKWPPSAPPPPPLALTAAASPRSPRRAAIAYVVDVGPFYSPASSNASAPRRCRRRDAELTGQSYYAGIGRTPCDVHQRPDHVGATPLVIQPTGPPAAATGSATRCAPSAVDGWKAACDAAASPGRRETPPGRHRRIRPHRPRVVMHRHHQPEDAPVVATTWPPATPSCCCRPRHPRNA